MKIIDWFKNLFKKVNDLREYLEDKLADLLEKIDKSKKVDELEKTIIAKGIDYGIEYCAKTNSVPSDFTQAIAEEVVKCLGKLNQLTQKQLRK